jgi:hypothetical protein
VALDDGSLGIRLPARMVQKPAMICELKLRGFGQAHRNGFVSVVAPSPSQAISKAQVATKCHPNRSDPRDLNRPSPCPLNAAERRHFSKLHIHGKILKR